MKQFHIYGIGNALLDIDFEVNDATLARLQIDKGVTTLIDEDMHHRLLEELDGVKHIMECGGSAANTLVTAQQLGAKTFYSCKVGQDEAGDFFYRNLILRGVHTNLHECVRDGVTGKCIVLVTPDADRTMNTFLGTTSTFSIAQLSESALKNSEFLYIEGYLVASPSACEAAIRAREIAKQHQVKTAITLSDPNMVKYFREGLCAIIGDKVDLLFANEQEAKLFTGSEDLEEIKILLKQYAHTFVITLGEDGALIYNGKEYIKISACPAKVVDTVGAGDIFAGTFLFALTENYSYYEAGRLASLAAARVVEKFGPRLTDNDIMDVRQMLKAEVEYA
jgi:sugar/nucleoside kinase (ribokinase family)